MLTSIVILPQLPWAQQRHLWTRAEAYGFARAYTYDHLSWRTLADQPWGATIPTLTAAAAVTSTIGLGTFVTSPNFRHPVPFAKDVATLDDIADGRLTLGIGAGGQGFDMTVLGGGPLSPRDRHERFEEFTRELDLLLRGEPNGPISFDGRFFRADAARMVGEPSRGTRVPFMIAANGPKGMRLAAELGQAWVTTGPDGVAGEDWWTQVAGFCARLDDIERDRPERLRRVLSLDSGGYSLTSLARYEDQAARAEALGFDEVVVHWPRADGGIYTGDEAVLDEVAGVISRR